jgi:hypothetical protein
MTMPDVTPAAAQITRLITTGTALALLAAVTQHQPHVGRAIAGPAGRSGAAGIASILRTGRWC